MLKGSAFYRDNAKRTCMGHPDCRRPCRYEPDERILAAAKRALRAGVLTQDDFRCIMLDMQGFPGKVILPYQGQDPTGAHSKKAKYACERAYAKIRRRLCQFCQMLWSFDKPKGPRVDANRELKYLRENWKAIRKTQGRGAIKIKRKKGTFSIADRDIPSDTSP
jgi:hypothetical protein